MKSIRFAIAATAVIVVLVVDAPASTRHGTLPVPGALQPAATIKPNTGMSALVPGQLVATPVRLSIATEPGVRTAVTFSVRYSGSGGVLDVRPGTGSHVSDPVVTSQGNGRFSLRLHTSDQLASGAYRGTLHLRMCADSSCANPIAGTATAVDYVVRVAAGPVITTYAGG